MRHCVYLACAGALLAIGLAQDARAQATSWPDKPVKLILPYAPGGATDLIGRPWADKLSQVMGQQFVIENRGGAGGMIGTEAAADGYTFLLTPNATLTILPSLRTVPYDALTSFEPVGRVGDLVCGFVIHPAVGVKDFRELVGYAKEHPGKLAYASAGLGTATQLRVEMLKYRAGIDILHVPYRGSADALNDLLPNTVQMMNEINVLPHVKAGKLILLNINYPTRHPDFPDVPTLTELGFAGADIPIWYLVLAPAGTPKDILAKFNATLIELAKSDDIIAKMRAINVIVPPQTPTEIRAHMVEDTKRNAELIKTANIKLE
jgi:tripartite-type tricarboxylate transporter receptor subunit TctC